VRTYRCVLKYPFDFLAIGEIDHESFFLKTAGEQWHAPVVFCNHQTL
jgi:hypothetical protein